MTIINKFIDFCDGYQIAIEGNVITDEDSLINNLSVVYEHMLKLKYRTQDQNNSWYSSIISFQRRFSKLKPGEVAEFFRNMEYIQSVSFKKGLEKAVNTDGTMYSYDMFPSDMPIEWTLINIINFSYIEKFIMKYALRNKKENAKDIINQYKKHKKCLDNMISHYNKYTR